MSRNEMGDAIQCGTRDLGVYPVPPLEVDISRLASHPLLLLDSSFVVRKTFDAACRLGKIEPNILIESHAPHTLACARRG